MNEDKYFVPDATNKGATNYSAPALEKGLDILELLCHSESPLSSKEISQKIDRTTASLYRMIMCLVDRGYLVNIDDRYTITTKIFELAHINPPTHLLLTESLPIMKTLANELNQSCHLTLYSMGKQIVLAKVENPSGMGFSVRVGAELDVLVSISGRVLLAFQDKHTRKERIIESIHRQPEQEDPQIEMTLETIKARGFDSAPSVQVRGLYAISFPILDSRGNAMAALTIPYAERIDLQKRRSISSIEEKLSVAAKLLTKRVGGKY